MEAVVVADGVAGDVVARLLGRNVAAGLADDDGDLAFVVEPLTTLGAHHVGPVAAQRRDGLMEVGRRCGQLGHELVDATVVVQVDTDDLGGLHGRQVGGIGDGDPAPIVGDEFVTVAHDLTGVAV